MDTMGTILRNSCRSGFRFFFPSANSGYKLICNTDKVLFQVNQWKESKKVLFLSDRAAGNNLKSLYLHTLIAVAGGSIIFLSVTSNLIVAKTSL